MKINLPGLLLILAGVLLIYSAYNDRDPRNVIFEALNIKRRVPDPTPITGGKPTWVEPKKPAVNPVPGGTTPGTPIVSV